MKATVALIGPKNSGKSTIFNKLTGSLQYTANWPGVTVEKKTGDYRYKKKNFEVIDLPGYSTLLPYSVEGRIIREVLFEKAPDIVLFVADAANLRKSLFLFLQLYELGLNMVLDFNMVDLLAKQRQQIDIGKLETSLGISCVESVGYKGSGIKDIKEAVYRTVFSHSRKDILEILYDKEVLEHLRHLHAHLDGNDLYNRFIIFKSLEKDPQALNKADKMGILPCVEKAILQLEKRYGDLEDMFPKRKHAFVNRLSKKILRPRTGKAYDSNISPRIDRILAHRFWGIPFLLLIIWLAFTVIFFIGIPLASGFYDMTRSFSSFASRFMTANEISPLMVSFIKGVLIDGIGFVLSFLPLIFLFFMIFSAIEDSGYISRAAFLSDRIMRIFGLSGLSFLPLILGFGCNVPSVLCARNLSSGKNRTLTVLAIPFMNCSARLSVFAVFVSLFFTRHQALTLLSLYILGILMAVLTVKIFSSFIPCPREPLFNLELTPYRRPHLNTMLLASWRRTIIFLKKAGSIIFLSIMVMWFLSYFPEGVFLSPQSYMVRIGRFLTPALHLIGIDDWRISSSLILGLSAKEMILVSLGSFSEGNAGFFIRSAFSPLSAYAFLILVLSYSPCLPTWVTIRKEIGLKWASLLTGYSLLMGFLFSVAFYQLARLF